MILKDGEIDKIFKCLKTISHIIPDSILNICSKFGACRKKLAGRKKKVKTCTEGGNEVPPWKQDSNWHPPCPLIRWVRDYMCMLDYPWLLHSLDKFEKTLLFS